MENKRVPLFERVPEIYKIKDLEQLPSGQLQSYLALIELIFGAIHQDIEALYDNLFIETCDTWVIPYIGDLLGTSFLSGDSWTLRADVADTIALRRRKGTIASIERLTANLTSWVVHCAALRDNLVWNQHLNHQRPDDGGQPPYASAQMTRFTPVYGGLLPLRDPAMLSLANTPFDPFAHLADLRPPFGGGVRYNLPNFAIFLWRLQAYRIGPIRPFFRQMVEIEGGPSLLCFDVHPQGDPVRLFNTHQYDPDAIPAGVTQLDGTPGPIPMARLNSGAPAGKPDKYVAITTYIKEFLSIGPFEITDVGFQLHLPEPTFEGQPYPDDPQIWSIRGANLCAWEEGLQPPPQNREVVIDPRIGRFLIAVQPGAEANAIRRDLMMTYTYGAAGEVGAHPIAAADIPENWSGQDVEVRSISYHENPDALRLALANLQDLDVPLAIVINDSMVHELDPAEIEGVVNEDDDPGLVTLTLNRSLMICAATNERPMIRLAKPLRFRPASVAGADEEEQDLLNARISALTVRLEGLFLTRDRQVLADNQALICRAALNQLELVNCTLDPEGHANRDGTRVAIHPALELSASYGFTDEDERSAFNQTPVITLRRCIAGPLQVDPGYELEIVDSIIDAGAGVGEEAEGALVISSAEDPAGGWGAPAKISGGTFFGRMRVEHICGQGGIWVHALEVMDNQTGCIRYSYFGGSGNRLPQHLGCLFAADANLDFVSSVFGEPGYGQLAATADFRIRERGPGDDAMGAYGFLQEAHKWRNLQIRFREFMPVGVRPVLIPVT